MRQSFHRASQVTVVLLAGLALSHCGKKQDDPSAVELTDLKAPGGLHVRDDGNGAVTLSWSGANFEEDFEGYNVYGATGTAADLGVTEGEPVRLLTDLGETVEATKTVLANFDYDTANSKALPGAPTRIRTQLAEDGGDEKKFSYLPIHQTNASKEAILPTCQPKSGQCVALTASTTKTAASSVTLNGRVSFAVSGLAVGSSYCFFVLAVQDEGEEVSAASSNVQCVTPRWKKELSFTPSASTKHRFDLRTYRSECETAGSCPDLSATSTDTTTTDFLSLTDTAPFAIEGLFFTPGKNVAIRDLGYFPLGFVDPDLPDHAPAVIYSFNNYTSGGAGSACSGKNCAQNGGGYSLPGQSIPILGNHVYAVATGDSAAADTTSYHYNWIWVKDTSPANGSAMTLEFRIPKSANQL